MTYQEITTVTSLFIFGLLGGFSHCTSMCGPFVLAQIGNRLSKIDINQATNFQKLSGLALLPYHFGRITTYCFIALFSAILSHNLKNISSFKNIAGLLLIIACLIIFNSTIAKIKLPFKIHFAMLNKVFKVNFKFFTIYSKALKNLTNSLFLNPTGFKNYLLGLILGFLPCGLVYGAIVASISLNNYLTVFLAMFAFGLGTVPALFATACGGYWFFGRINQNYLKIFTKTILLVNMATLLLMAFGLIFNKI
jgi:hypothetical protein